MWNRYCTISNPWKRAGLAALLFLLPLLSTGQGLHFSQFYSAPLLVSPANAGLMNEKDFRLGAQYRDQWKSIPAPFTTYSIFGDTKLFKSERGENWMGLGLAWFNDKAGDGELSLTRFDAAIAYHLMMGETTMLSLGLQGGMNQRTVNYDKLSFNEQWDGFRFNFSRSNGEKNGLVRTQYFDVGAGINLALFPSPLAYYKIGVSVAHVNRPTETFYGEPVNQVGLRPTLSMEGIIALNNSFSFSPSLYFTTQKSAYELLFGSLTTTMVGGSPQVPTNLIIGGFYRWNDAAIAVFGMEFGEVKILSSYDYTTSSLKTNHHSGGAFELSFVYQGHYEPGPRGRNVLNCPRF